MTFVLDASAVLRYIDNEAGELRVVEIFEKVLLGQAHVVMSAVNYGEVIGIAHKRGGQTNTDRTAARLSRLGIQVVPADQVRSERSAILHITHGIPYADSFAAELAGSPNHVLVTSDFDFKPVEQEISIEFLPKKPDGSLLR